MRELLQRPVFRVRDQTYSWEDVAVAGALWGDWERVREDARAGLACLRAFREAGRALPDAEIEDAAVEFRYAHEMVSAQEAEEWLQRWALGASEWMDYIRRSVLRRKLATRIPDLLARQPIRDDEVAAAAAVEAICSGFFLRLAPKLAARAAVHERIRTERQNGAPLFPDEAVDGIAEAIPSTGLDVDPERGRASRRRVAALELALGELRETLLTPRALAEQVSAHHLEWIRVEYEALEYPAESMAREALLCVREDGMSFEELAGDSGVASLRADSAWVGELAGPLHAALLGARPGDVVGPFPAGRAHALYRLREKHLPSPDDAEVRSRAERSVLQRALAAELQHRVQWLITL